MLIKNSCNKLHPLTWEYLAVENLVKSENALKRRESIELGHFDGAVWI